MLNSQDERVMGYLQEINVRVNHGVTEVRLDVGHRLTFNLQTIPHPHVTVDLRQASLHTQTQIIGWITTICIQHCSMNIITSCSVKVYRIFDMQ